MSQEESHAPKSSPEETRKTSSVVILRQKRVSGKTGLSRATIYAYMAKGLFPKNISLGERSVGWLESEIDSWLASRIALRG